MAAMKLEFLYGNAVGVLPLSVLDVMAQADTVDFKVLIHLCADGSLRQADKLSDIFARLSALIGCRRDKAEAAVKFWADSGVIAICDTADAPAQIIPANAEKKTDAAPPVNIAQNPPAGEKPSPEQAKSTQLMDTVPTYTGEELQRILDENNGQRRHLLDECQNMVGKIFSMIEINKFIWLMDGLRLESEHILLLFAYCCQRGKNSVPYITKTASNLYDEGVDTLEKFEAYIKKKEEYEALESKLRRLFGYGDRVLTPKEKSCIKAWTKDWGFSYEIIERGYQITVESITGGKFAINYLHKVLENWHNAGYQNLSEIEEALKEYKSVKNQKQGENSSSFDVDEFYELALKRSYEKMQNAIK